MLFVRVLMLSISIITTFPILCAMQPLTQTQVIPNSAILPPSKDETPKKPSITDILNRVSGSGYADDYGQGNHGRLRSVHLSKAMEMLRLLNMMPEIIAQIQPEIDKLKGLENDLNKLGSEREKYTKRRIGYEQALNYLQAELTKQSAMGRAVARGLAGTDGWQAIQDENVEGIFEGIQLGGTLRVSKECGDILGKRIAGTVDRVVGGAWDGLINSLLDMWKIIGEMLFPSTPQPFTMKELHGWQDVIKVIFADLEQLLKEGQKDSLRGKDSTLRRPDEDVQHDEELAVNIWKILIDGYVRQLNYFVATIDAHELYYDEKIVQEPMITFYAEELRRRIVEIQSILKKPQTLNALDKLIDSNKSLITAMRKNIEILLQKLIEQIDISVGGRDSASSTTPRTGRVGKVSDDDGDESFPKSFRNW